MAETEQKPDERKNSLTGLKTVVDSIPTRIFQKEAWLVVGTLIAGGIGTALAQDWQTNKIDTQTEKKVAPLKKQNETLAAELANLKLQVDANERRAAERFDVLYRFMATGRRDPRAEELSNPAPPVQTDGGK